MQGGYEPGEKVGWREGAAVTEVYVGNLAFRTGREQVFQQSDILVTSS